MADTPKKVRPNKKTLIREIIENNDHFNVSSLERTNIQNLTEIKRLVLLTRGERRMGFVCCAYEQHTLFKGDTLC